MNTFKQFNENIRDVLLPKSKEEIGKALQRFTNNDDLIRYIIKYKLPYEFLPRNEEGRCVINKNLYYASSNIEILPDNFTVNGMLDISYSSIKELPDGLIVRDDLWCLDTDITKLKDDTIIGGKTFFKTTYKVYESVKNVLLPKSIDKIKDAMKGKNIYSKIYTIKNTPDLEKIFRYPSKKKLYDVINKPFENYEQVYKDIIDDKKIKFSKVRMNDVEYFQLYQLIVDYIKVICNTEKKIFEFAPNTHVIRVFGVILNHLESEYIFKPVYKENGFDIFKLAKKIFNRDLLLQNGHIEVNDAYKKYTKSQIRIDINSINYKFSDITSPYWSNLHGWEIERKYVKKHERKFGKT